MMNNSTRCQLLFQLADQEYFTTDEFVNCISDLDTPVEIVVVGLVLITLTLLTAGGNLLIGLAILLVRRLRNPANLLILNLALADFLVSVLVLPFAIAYQLKGYWPFGQQVCDVFLLLDVLLCTASILNLCAISVDRYLAITKPLNYAASRTSKRMLWMIIICWLMAALISIPPVLSFKKNINETYCSYSEDLAYQVYATFSAFFIPLLVMLVLYGRIYVIVRRLALQDALILTNMSKYVGNGPIAPEEATQNRNPLLTTIVTSDSHTNATESMAPTPSSNYLSPDYSLQLSRTKQSIQICIDDCPALKIQGPDNSSNRKAQEQLQNNHKTNESRRSTIRPQLLSLLRGRLSNRNSSVIQAPRRKAALHSTENMKAVITLGVIMGSFTLCWLPFFICQLVSPILKAFQVNLTDVVPIKLFQCFLWLGYMNSLLNPIIYAKFNQEFRLPFYYILKCQCRGINQRVRRQQFTTQFELKGRQPQVNVDPMRLSGQRPFRRLTQFRESGASDLQL